MLMTAVGSLSLMFLRKFSLSSFVIVLLISGLGSKVLRSVLLCHIFDQDVSYYARE